MFDIGWSELLIVAVIAVVFVGPKDLPRMLRVFGKTMGKMRRMAGDFQRQFNDALKEAELDDIKKSVEAIGKDDPFSAAQRDIEAAGRSLDNKPAQTALTSATPVKAPTGMTGPRAVNPAIMTGPTAAAGTPPVNGSAKSAPATPQIISAREASAPADAAGSETPPAPAAAGGR
jgi:sec-independent protein translocase protein TatB